MTAMTAPLALMLLLLPCQAQESRPASRPQGAKRAASARPPKHTNRLIHEKSPYLLQHAHNPVDWWPWCEKAFQEARRLKRPVFLSIGYSTCHWCHVMERESFEDRDTAAYMNQHYVCIKLDREERPDLDAFYMQYVTLTNHGQGGWPASLWLRPDRSPFFAGTYFPKQGRYGLPSFMDVLKGLFKAWKERRPDIDAHVAQVMKILRERTRGQLAKSLPSLDCLGLAARTFFENRDPLHGGFQKSAPKFPSTTTHELMFLASRLEGKPEWGQAALQALDAMARGGIHDQVGGGFHRYATDVNWRIPHFEKMLYDQARIASTSLQAFVFSKQRRYALLAEDILDGMLRDFRSQQGAFMTAFDADSGGQEGSYYVWTLAELKTLLAPPELALMQARFAISKEGNWAEEPGRNILEVRQEWALVARQLQQPEAAVRASWKSIQARLLKQRNRRPRPALDTKILSGWNGLCVTALARAARLLQRPDYLAAANQAADFVLQKMRAKDGRLLRRYAGGEARFQAVLTDYAFLIQGLMDLFEASGEPRRIQAAVELARFMKADFEDPEGGFFDAPEGTKGLLLRTRDIYDGAIPSGNGYGARALLRLADLTGREDLRKLAQSTLKAFKHELENRPWVSPTLVHADLLAREGPLEIVIVGNPADPRTAALRRVVNQSFLPSAVRCLMSPSQALAGVSLIPLLQGRTATGAVPLAYVCRAGLCKAPAATPAALRQALLASGPMPK